MFDSDEIESIKKDNDWDRAILIEKYSQTCGVVVVSMVLGINRAEAAIKLAEIREPGGDWTYTRVDTIGAALGKKVESVKIDFLTRFPTLSRWIEANKKRIAIVRADHHFALVAYGHVLDKNWEDGRARVTQVIYLD